MARNEMKRLMYCHGIVAHRLSQEHNVLSAAVTEAQRVFVVCVETTRDLRFYDWPYSLR
jgi:hypothetical protein